MSSRKSFSASKPIGKVPSQPSNALKQAPKDFFSRSNGLAAGDPSRDTRDSGGRLPGGSRIPAELDAFFPFLSTKRNPVAPLFEGGSFPAKDSRSPAAAGGGPSRNINRLPGGAPVPPELDAFFPFLGERRNPIAPLFGAVPARELERSAAVKAPKAQAGGARKEKKDRSY